MDPGDADREALENRVAELEQTVKKMLPDRRGVLKGLGAAAVGGAAVSGATGGASGQSGPAGSQGTPEKPNNMYAWDLDVQNGATFNGTDIENAGSVSTAHLKNEVGKAEIISRFNGLVVPVADGLGMGDAVNPDNTLTPIQDAVDAVESSNNAGVVLLPPGDLLEDDTINVTGNVLIKGVNRIGTTITQYNIGAGKPGIVFEEGTDFYDNFGGLVNIRLRGTGDYTNNSGPKVIIDGMRGGLFDNLWLERGGEQGILVRDTGTTPYELTFGNVSIWKTGGVGFEATGGGPGNTIQNMFIGSCAGAMNIEGGNWDINSLNIGPVSPGPGDSVVRTELSNGRRVNFGEINIEPEGNFYANGGETAVLNLGTGRNRYDAIRLLNMETDYVFRAGYGDVGQSSAWILGQVYTFGSTVNQNTLEIVDEPTAESWYFGKSSNIDNTADTATGLVRSLATAGTGNA